MPMWKMNRRLKAAGTILAMAWGVGVLAEAQEPDHEPDSLATRPGAVTNRATRTSLDGTLIVANRSGGSISFIDLAAGVEIARVPVGPIIPHEVAVSPDGTRVLTGEYGPEDDHGRHIVLIDVASASVEARIDLGPESRPHTPLFLPGGRHAVATMQESDQLALVDLEARSVVRTYPTGGREGHMVRLSPDGSRAYVTSRGAEGTLSVIFLEEERAPVVIETGLGAEGLDVSADGGEVWVANRREETISVIDAESLEVVATLESRPFSGRIEMGPHGYAIVPNGGGQRSPVPRFVRLWDVKTRDLIAEVPMEGEPYEGNFGALIHGGMALVSDPGEGLIQVYDLNGGLSARRLLIDNHDAPDGMAWTPVRVDVMAMAGMAGAQEMTYREIPDWIQPPNSRAMGSVSSVYADGDGNLWIAERCGRNSCVDRDALAPIHMYDPSGRWIRGFGAGMFVWPHGIYVDSDGNVWVTDGQGDSQRGHQVFKFSPDGEVLMTLGEAGVAGSGPGQFNGPTDVVVAPNGDIFVSDGHDPDSNNRVQKFSADGQYLASFGSTGSGPGEFIVPHAIAMDSRGRLFVADRDGVFLDQWHQFGRASGLYITADDALYVSDNQSNTERNPGWERGIRAGSAVDGVVEAFIPDPTFDPANAAATGAHGLSANSAGEIFGAEVGAATVRKYVRH